MLKRMKMIMRGLAVVIVPFTASMPAVRPFSCPPAPAACCLAICLRDACCLMPFARLPSDHCCPKLLHAKTEHIHVCAQSVFVYWITSNFFSLGQTAREFPFRRP